PSAPADAPHPRAPLSTPRVAWPALMVAAIVVLAFLPKAHTIDDVTFLTMAEHASRDPLHPTALWMVSDGSRIRLSSALVTGPVMAWLLLPSIALGSAEWAAHLVQLVLLAAAILATAALARRIGADAATARVSAMLLATMPAVLPMATTAMPDVPAMAFGAVG